MAAHATLELAVPLLEDVSWECAFIEGFLEDLFGEGEVVGFLCDPGPRRGGG